MANEINDFVENNSDSDAICEFRDITSESDSYHIDDHSTGIMFVPENAGYENQKSYGADYSDLAKYIRRENPEIGISIETADVHVRHSGDIWLPLVILAQDVSLQLFVGLVVNYAWDKAKGALKGRQNKVHCSAIYEDQAQGKFKKFEFSGTPEALEYTLEKLNDNEFFGD